MTPADLPELLTIDEAAALMRRTPAAVRHLIARGQMPGLVRHGRRVNIRRDDLRKALGLAS